MNRPGVRAVALLFVSTLAVYFTTLRYGFLSWDDDVNITGHPAVMTGAWRELWQQSYYGMYIPVSYSVWALLARISSVPALFHGANLLLHFGNSLLVYLLLRRWLARPELAVWGALLFCVHPLQVETVAWASGLRDLLACFLALAALNFHLRARRGAEVLALGIFCLALLSKPSVIALPLIALVLRPRPALALWVLVAAAVPWLTAAAQSHLGTAADVAWYWRPWVAIEALGFYCSKLMWPSNLSVDYGLSPAQLVSQFAWVISLLLLWIVAYFLRGLRYLAFVFILILPVLGLVHFAFEYVSLVADHYMYLPMLGAAALFALLAGHSRIVAASVLVVFAALAQARTLAWSNNDDFYQDMVSKNPSSFQGYVGLGDEAKKRGEFIGAVENYRQALRLSPVNGLAMLNLAQCLSLLHADLDLVNLLTPVLQGTLEFNDETTPYYANLFFYYGVALDRLGRFSDSYANLCQAVRLKSDNEPLRETLLHERLKVPGAKDCLP